ncbi:MAG: apolipoprotein N-acyltransferase [Magnetococcales bacterium]|nr:apolipoprotein N-acyltransferase [Magnetococcales bacterium]NGZ27056.1 apolipoprotein N-acyltransferase [Magnetococcales bacterium]
MTMQALTVSLGHRLVRSLYHPFQPTASRLLTNVIAFVAGAVGVLGFPPYSLVGVLMVTFAILLSLSWSRPWKRRFAHGFYFGLGHFIFGFHWLLTSLNEFGHIPLPVSILMLFLLSALMAVYPALFAVAVPPLTPHLWWLPITAPLLWSGSEWLRSHVFTGFAWNLAGYSWNTWPSILQVADIGGVYLLSWLTMAVASLLVLAMRREGRREEMHRALILAILLIALAHGYGHWRLTSPPPVVDQAILSPLEIQPPLLKVALVQGNIPQNMKWQPEFQAATMQTYTDLSRTVARKVDVVIWPETAIPLFLQASPHYIRHMGKLTEEINAPILAGAPTASKQDDHWAYHNSLLMLDSDQSLHRRYDKHHLVPFGEYIPLRRYLPGNLQKLTVGADDFQPGPGPIPMPWSKGAIGALICYEADVPAEVRQLALAGAKWLVNPTNDGWFGEDAKPQHLAMAKYRAVENRLPMIRVANTGISAAFDAYGRELGRLESNRQGVLELTIPKGWGDAPYHRIGDWWMLFALAVALAVIQLVHLPSRLSQVMNAPKEG